MSSCLNIKPISFSSTQELSPRDPTNTTTTALPAILLPHHGRVRIPEAGGVKVGNPKPSGQSKANLCHPLPCQRPTTQRVLSFLLLPQLSLDTPFLCSLPDLPLLNQPHPFLDTLSSPPLLPWYSPTISSNLPQWRRHSFPEFPGFLLLIPLLKLPHQPLKLRLQHQLLPPLCPPAPLLHPSGSSRHSAALRYSSTCCRWRSYHNPVRE